MLIQIYLITLPIFLAIDMVWLGVVASDFYKREVGFLMRGDVNRTAAVIFYLLYVAGLVLFVIAPALDQSSWLHAFLYGALFGLITYATYDLTNLATIKNWPLRVTLVDLLWGTVLAASVSTISYAIAAALGL